MGMYRVDAKCGHVGRGHYVVKSFAVIADSAKQAAEKARMCPRVKHHHKDAIRQVVEIDAIQYHELWREHREDPYFTCHNIQQQRQCCCLVLFDEVEENKIRNINERCSDKTVYHHKQQIRNPKKYIRYMYSDNGRNAA